MMVEYRRREWWARGDFSRALNACLIRHADGDRTVRVYRSGPFWVAMPRRVCFDAGDSYAQMGADA